MKHEKVTRLSRLVKVGLLMVAVAFAFNKLYPVRHELLKKVIYPQKLVPERNDHYRIKNIWTPEQAEKLLDVVKA